MAKIHGGLMEAYLGYNEDEWVSEYDREMAGKKTDIDDYQTWSEKKAEQVIRAHTPKQRFAIYLEWNGILGYTETLWEITQGEFEV